MKLTLPKDQQQTALVAAAAVAVGALVYLAVGGRGSSRGDSDNSCESGSTNNSSNSNSTVASNSSSSSNAATAIPERIDGGKEQGLSEEIAAVVSRICTLYKLLDYRERDSISTSTAMAMCTDNIAAQHVFENTWGLGEKDNLDRVTCNETVHYFLRVKSLYGYNAMCTHLACWEAAAQHVADRAPANITVRRGSGGGSGTGGDSDEASTIDTMVANGSDKAKQDLPASWLPIVTARIVSIFRRIDLNGDHSIDKDEILSLHGGDRTTTESMFADLDVNHDGIISPQEFVEYFFRVLKRCEEKDRKDLVRNSPMRVNAQGNLERDTSKAALPDKALGASLTKGRKMVNKIAGILEHKLTERDDRLNY